MGVTIFPSTSDIKFTYEDYLQLPDDGKRYEIIDGEIYLLPTPPTVHQQVLGNLFCSLYGFVEYKNAGEVFISPLDVVFSETNVIQPDILFISNERSNIITEANIQGAPDLVIEVTWPATEQRDRGIKRMIYAKFGVREYWLVDPASKALEICRLQERNLRSVARLSVNDVLNTALLPGLKIAVQEIFQR
jgi:Uma2 family endonuclease